MRTVIIKEVDIENFKCIKNRHLEFHPRVNVLYGRNGVGKTSILDAIYYAFRPEIPNREVIKYGENEAHIRVVFCVGNKEYVIEKTLRRRKTNSAYLRGPGVKLKGSKNISSYVNELGIGKVCSEWWYVTQTSIALLVHHLSAVSSRNRAVSFVQSLYGLFPLETFQELYGKWRSTLGIVTDKNQEIVFSAQLDTARAKLQEFERTLLTNEPEIIYNGILEQLREIEGRIQSPEFKLTISYQRNKQLEDSLKELLRKKQELFERRKERYAQLRNELLPYSRFFSHVNNLESLPLALEGFRNTVQEVFKTKREISSAINKLQHLFRTRPAYPEGSYQKTKRHDFLFQKVVQYKAVLESLLRDEQDKCPMCLQNITKEHIRFVKARYNELLDEYSQLGREVEKIVEVKRQRDEIKRKIREIIRGIRTLRTRLIDFDKTEAEFNLWFEGIKRLCEDCVNMKREQDSYETKIKQVEAQLEVVSEILHANPQIPDNLDVEELLRKRDELKNKLKQLEPAYLNYHYAKTNIDGVKKEIEELEGKLAQVHSRQKLYEEVTTFFNNFRNIFTECSFDFLRNYLIKPINDYLVKYDCGFVLDLRDEPFGFVARMNGGSLVSLEHLSFGQKVFTSLLFLLTLHRILPVQQFILLDEPLLGLDAANRSAFTEIMEEYNGCVIAATATSPFGNRIEIQ